MDLRTAAPPALAFGPFVLDIAAGRLLRDGQPVDLAPRPWAVLVHLASRPGQLVSKDELLDAVWGHRHVSDAALKVAINGLRSKLGDDAAAPTCIATVSRRGYRFIAPVSALVSAPVPIPPAPPAAAPTPAPVTAAGSAAPPLDSPAAGAGNLPGSPPRLLGREQALAALHAQLPRERLLTLVGPGGVGKTQLALAAARHLPPADGVWLLRLDSLADAGPLLDTLARTLALGANASRDEAALAQALSPLAVRLVLDNAEHLVDALAPLLARLLAEAPRLTVLVTSQTALRVAGEVVMPVTALAVPPAGQAADLLAWPAVALFVERVRALAPGYTPGEAELADIAALCRLLDGLPLALELAAARVPLLGTAAVLARIGDRLDPGREARPDDRFNLLSRGPRDAPQRHRTLRQALEWSFGLLDEATRRVQRRLSVCAGAFTLKTAQAVAADGDGAAGAAPTDDPLDGWAVLEALQTLLDQSLLVTEPAGSEDGAERRYRQLESVRALAAEQLHQAGEAAVTQGRLVQAMSRLFGHAQAHYTRTPLLHWLRPLRPEADNLRLAMSHAVARLEAPAGAEPPGGALDEAVALFSHAVLFWLRSGRKREALGWFQALAPRVAAGLQSPPLRAHYGLAVGSLAAYAQSMPPAEALPWLEEAEQVFTAQGEGRLALLALYLHAALLQRVAPQGDRSALLARMRALEQPGWSLRERNFAAWTEAVNAHGRGDLQAFRDFCALDLQRARDTDDRAEAWVAAFGLGQALWTLGERARAAQVLAEAVDDLRAAGLLREYATTAALAASMRLALDGNETPEAGTVAAMREAADVIRAEGMLWWMGDALMLLPARRGEWAAAVRLRAWIDARMDRLGMKRSPVAQSLRDDFERRIGTARAAPGWLEPPEPTPDEALEDAMVLRLGFG